jgi:hypothetical protein
MPTAQNESAEPIPVAHSESCQRPIRRRFTFLPAHSFLGPISVS